MRDETFDLSEMRAMLPKETRRALADGYPALRVTGEMTRVLQGLSGLEKLT